MSTKLLVIGIDGATWDVIDPLIEQNKLPNIKKLLEQGVKAPLKSMHPLSTPIIWTTIATGKKPVKHGITHHLDTQRNLRCKRVWDILETKGREIGVFGWPLIDPPRKVDGFLIPGFFARSDKTYPEKYDFITKLRPDHGLRTILESLVRGLFNGISISTSADLIRFEMKKKRYPYLLKYFQTKMLRTRITSAVFKHIFKKGKTEFSAFYMNHTDQIGHRMWVYYEPEKFEYRNKEEIRRYGDAIQETYILADRIIGELLRTLSDEYHVMILSDHGMKASSEEKGFRIRGAVLFDMLAMT